MKLQLLVALISAICSADLYAASEAKPANFDVNILKSRGLSPQIADFFKSEKRYAEGINFVTVQVNGSKLGIIDAKFDAQGQLCVTPAFLDFTHISLPDGVALPSSNPADLQPASCIDLVQYYPEAIIRLRPGVEQVELIVPPTALRNTASNNLAAGVTSGGSAALLNYDILDSRNHSPGSSSRTLQAQTELGFNTHDWIFRSRQSYSSSNGVQQFNNVNAYAQKTLVDQKLILQIGQINPASNLFSLPVLLGAQVTPEAALLPQTSAGVSASGIAQSEARVEVRQKGILIYSTVVPPGPFTLRQIPVIDSSTDLNVKVIETGGEERSFIVPSGSFNVGFIQAARSFSFAIGKQDQSSGFNPDGSNADSGWLSTVNGNLPLGERVNLSSGAVLASNYHGAGFGVSAAPTRNSSLNLNNVWSHQTRSGWIGTQVLLNGSAQLLRNLSVYGSLQQRTKKFRNVGDPSGPVVTDNGLVFSTGYKQQQTANLSYQLDKFGALGLGYSKYIGFDKKSSERMIASWSQNIGRASLTVSAEHSNNENQDNALFLALNIPIGRRSINTSSSRQGDRVQNRVSVSEQVNDFVGYSASANTDNSNNQIGSSANLNLTPKYTQLGFGANYQGSSNSSFNSSASGAVVAHQGGVTFSPYHVQDTFAVATLPNISGARINTPQGPVWTDFSGQAVVPSMPAYAEGRLEVTTKSLPRTTDIKNAIRTVRLGRGAVTNIGFDIIQTRRALLRLLNKDHRPVDKGTAIFDESGAWITSIGNDGSLFLDDKQLKTGLKAVDAAGRSCSFSYRFPDEIDPDALYDTADVTCI